MSTVATEIDSEILWEASPKKALIVFNEGMETLKYLKNLFASLSSLYSSQRPLLWIFHVMSDMIRAKLAIPVFDSGYESLLFCVQVCHLSIKRRAKIARICDFFVSTVFMA